MNNPSKTKNDVNLKWKLIFPKQNEKETNAKSMLYVTLEFNQKNVPTC